MDENAHGRDLKNELSELQVRVSCECTEQTIPLKYLGAKMRCEAEHLFSLGATPAPKRVQISRSARRLYQSVKQRFEEVHSIRLSEEYVAKTARKHVIATTNATFAKSQPDHEDGVIYWLIRDNPRDNLENLLFNFVFDDWQQKRRSDEVLEMLDLGRLLAGLKTDFQDQVHLVSFISERVVQISNSNWHAKFGGSIAESLDARARMKKLSSKLLNLDDSASIELLNWVLTNIGEINFEQHIDQYRYDPSAGDPMFPITGESRSVTIRVRDQRKGRYLNKRFE